MARLIGVDLPREKRLEIALTYIYGVGRTRAKETLAATGISGDLRVKDLGDTELVAIRDYLEASYKLEGDLRREVAADTLGNHGAQSIEFYGRWSWHSLEPHPAAPVDGSLRDPTPGRTYEIHLGETTTRVRLDSESRITILRGSANSRDLSRIPVTHLKPQVLLFTWQEADRTTNVHVYDFESGEAHAVVSYFNRSVKSVRGTVRRVD